MSRGDPSDFSLMLGGPLYQLYLRTRLARPPLHLLRRRLIGITLATWLPLLALSALAGHAVSGVPVPFVLDLDVHARFLGALPLFITAEVVVHRQLRPILMQFLERGIVAPEDRPRFEAIVASVGRVRDSVLLELLLLVFVFTVGHWVWRDQLALRVETWYAAPADGGLALTPAGYWYALVGLPMFRFVTFRWYLRVSLWCWLLWRVRGLRLHLNPLHADRAGGLGFLSDSGWAFMPFLLAHSVLLAGMIGNRVWHSGAALPEFTTEIVGVVMLLLLFVLAPLTFFARQLAEVQRAGRRVYGTLASRYADDFEQKWLGGRAPDGEVLLGSADIQSLADLGNSFEVVDNMRIVPVSWATVARLATTVGLPLLPLLLTVMPLDEIITRLVTLVF